MRQRASQAREFLSHVTARGIRATHHSGKIGLWPSWRLTDDDAAKVRELHGEILEALADVATF